MGKIKIKFKAPSKAKIKREIKRNIRKNLICPQCGHKLPYTNMSRTKCSRCRTNVSIKI